MSSDEITVKVVEAYRDGQPFPLVVEEVECGHHLDAALVRQAREAIRAGRESGLSISISSAWRSMKKQQALYDGYTSNDPAFNPADRPGFSKHQAGECLDLHFGSDAEREEFAALSVAHGFSRPIHREPWHFLISPQKPEPTS